MQINITGHHITVTPALKSYAEQKIERIIRHYADVTNIHIILNVEKERQRAEATLHVSGAKLFANDEKDDMYAAIDGLINKLDRQIKKHKEKLTNHRTH